MENWWHLETKWETSLDVKNRLLIPCELLKEMFGKKDAVGKKIFFGVAENGGHIIMSPKKKKQMPYEKQILCSRTYYRLLMPIQLRNTNSFYYGRKVTLVFFKEKNVVEIWPRP